MASNVESIAVLDHSGGLEPLGQPLSVAQLATRTDLVTASNRVPCRVSPLYFAADSHGLPMSQEMVGDVYCNLTTASRIGRCKHKREQRGVSGITKPFGVCSHRRERAMQFAHI